MKNDGCGSMRPCAQAGNAASKVDVVKCALEQVKKEVRQPEPCRPALPNRPHHRPRVFPPAPRA